MARYTASWRGVEESRSSPRTTWVIRISMSSTATASVYSGLPSARASTKSGTFAWSKVTSPRTRSVNVVDAVRHAQPDHRRRPSARKAPACSAVTVRQCPS